MGLAVSRGNNNDELVDNLIEHESIKTGRVEHIMRLVDRGRFLPESEREEAYKDAAWKADVGPGFLHISAPCIYASVLEGLDVQKGMSFLNIGSGTGYLSTMVGFMLGETGVSHGIELYENVVRYAEERAIETLGRPEVSAFGWCCPQMRVGNAFQIDTKMRYDRIYVGALVPPSRRSYFCKFLNVGGILIMPFGHALQRVTRRSEVEFVTKDISAVTFSHLIPVNVENPLTNCPISFPTVEPPSLAEACRRVIRSQIREVTAESHRIVMRSQCEAAQREKELRNKRRADSETTDERPNRGVATVGRRDARDETGRGDVNHNERQRSPPQRHRRVRHPMPYIILEGGLGAAAGIADRRGDDPRAVIRRGGPPREPVGMARQLFEMFEHRVHRHHRARAIRAAGLLVDEADVEPELENAFDIEDEDADEDGTPPPQRGEPRGRQQPEEEEVDLDLGFHFTLETDDDEDELRDTDRSLGEMMRLRRIWDNSDDEDTGEEAVVIERRQPTVVTLDSDSDEEVVFAHSRRQVEEDGHGDESDRQNQGDREGDGEISGSNDTSHVRTSVVDYDTGDELFSQFGYMEADELNGQSRHQPDNSAESAGGHPTSSGDENSCDHNEESSDNGGPSCADIMHRTANELDRIHGSLVRVQESLTRISEITTEIANDITTTVNSIVGHVSRANTNNNNYSNADQAAAVNSSSASEANAVESANDEEDVAFSTPPESPQLSSDDDDVKEAMGRSGGCGCNKRARSRTLQSQESLAKKIQRRADDGETSASAHMDFELNSSPFRRFARAEANVQQQHSSENGNGDDEDEMVSARDSSSSPATSTPKKKKVSDGVRLDPEVEKQAQSLKDFHDEFQRRLNSLPINLLMRKFLLYQM